MCLYCSCGPAHQPGCPLGSTGGAVSIPTNVTEPLRVSWECTRCDRANAPHLDQCPCVSEPRFNVVPTPFLLTGFTISEELMDEVALDTPRLGSLTRDACGTPD